jgi:hypothetical protein
MSPTRFIIDIWKRNKSAEARGKLLWRWNIGWFLFEILVGAVLIAASAAVDKIPMRIAYWSIAAFYLAFSRAAEVSYAFARDVSDRLGEMQPQSVLTSRQRIVMAFRSYVGLIVNFAVMLFFLPELSRFPVFGWSLPYDQELFSKANSFFDMLYFSVTTITTTGYGDMAPSTWPTRVLVMWEVLSGLLLIAITLAIYLSPSDTTQSKE